MTKDEIRKLRFAVVDEVWDHFSLRDSDNADVEWFEENIEKPLLALICHYEGHVVVDDQCDIPDHRYCAVCGKMMPNEPVSE